jgi:type II secretory pathway component PulM
MPETNYLAWGGLGLAILGLWGTVVKWLSGKILKAEKRFVSLEKFSGQVRLCGSEIRALRDENKEHQVKLDDLRQNINDNKVEFIERINDSEKAILGAINKANGGRNG